MLYQKPSVLLFPDYVFVLHASMYPDAEAWIMIVLFLAMEKYFGWQKNCILSLGLYILRLRIYKLKLSFYILSLSIREDALNILLFIDRGCVFIVLIISLLYLLMLIIFPIFIENI